MNSLGGAWQSHGVPFNRSYNNAIEQLISKNSNHSIWNPAPGGLSQSNIGVKGTEEFIPGWSFVFDVQAGFDPYSLELSDGPRSLVQNNGVPLGKQSANGDSSRAGQWYNSVGYAGISSRTFGTLTVGRQNSLPLDGILAYDPLGGSNDFSVIGTSSTGSGTGDTEDARFTTSLKYRVNLPQFDFAKPRVAALYQFGTYSSGDASNGAWQFDVGSDFLGGEYGTLSVDAIYSHVVDAVSLAALSAAQNAKAPDTLAATISNNTGGLLLAKYTYGPATIYGGYENIKYQNPSDPQGGFRSIAGFYVLTGNINNTAYTKNRTLQILWTGVKYAILQNVDVAAGYYHYIQDSYATSSCSNTSSSKCSGTLDAVSFDVDWRILPKLDAYTGVMFSSINGGLASGYLHHTTADPAAGLRFRF